MISRIGIHKFLGTVYLLIGMWLPVDGVLGSLDCVGLFMIFGAQFGKCYHELGRFMKFMLGNKCINVRNRRSCLNVMYLAPWCGYLLAVFWLGRRFYYYN